MFVENVKKRIQNVSSTKHISKTQQFQKLSLLSLANIHQLELRNEDTKSLLYWEMLLDFSVSEILCNS